MTLEKIIDTIKDLNKKANLLNKSIPRKNIAKFANNPFKEVKKENTYVWIEKD